jgi:hypothetical protein
MSIHIDDILQCDGCKKDGSFYGDDYVGGDIPQLYGAEWDKNIYCNDCIPEWWAEKLESEVERLRCEKCGISSREVSLISEADICYQCEKEESEVE